MNELALFSGSGGGILGGKLLGWRTVCAVEIEPYSASVLIQRQNDGVLDPFPIWDDVRDFDGTKWKGVIDVVSGGFPCQDLSIVRNVQKGKSKRKGLDGEHSGLWFHFARIIGEVRPLYAFVENSPQLVSKGLDRVLGSLAEMGYDARWCCLGANEVGASHKRERVWILARDAKVCRLPGSKQQLEQTLAEREQSFSLVSACTVFPRSENELPQPLSYGESNGVADRVDRTKAIGNGQVPLVAATAFTFLQSQFK